LVQRARRAKMVVGRPCTTANRKLRTGVYIAKSSGFSLVVIETTPRLYLSLLYAALTALQSLAWKRPSHRVLSPTWLWQHHMIPGRVLLSSSSRYRCFYAQRSNCDTCDIVPKDWGPCRARKHFRKLVGPFRVLPCTSTLTFKLSVNSLELLVCATNMIRTTKHFSKPGTGRCLTIPAARRHMYTTSAPRVAVLYQELDPPLINGVRKPKKPRGT